MTPRSTRPPSKAPSTAYLATAAQALADVEVQQGRILARLGKGEAAMKALEDATARYRKIVAEKPGNIAVQIAAARAYRELGDYLLMNGKIDPATKYEIKDLGLGAIFRQHVISKAFPPEYVLENVAGWNNQNEFLKKTTQFSNCIKIDNGLNSAWMVNLDELKDLL